MRPPIPDCRIRFTIACKDVVVGVVRGTTDAPGKSGGVRAASAAASGGTGPKGLRCASPRRRHRRRTLRTTVNFAIEEPSHAELLTPSRQHDTVTVAPSFAGVDRVESPEEQFTALFRGNPS